MRSHKSLSLKCRPSEFAHKPTLRGNLLDMFDHQIVRQYGIQGIPPLFRAEVGITGKASGVVERVDARIGASRAMNLDLFSGEFKEGCF